MWDGRVGIDLVPFSRVRKLLAPGSERALYRLLTAEEIGILRLPDDPDVEGIAGRLAAKEAVFKLFHLPGQALPWRGIEILRGAGGWPEVRLSGRASELAATVGIGHIEVSIAHDSPCAIAVAYSTCVSDRGKEKPTSLRAIEETDMPSADIGEVREWILSRHPERQTIAADENLIESRLVDSLSFVELVYAIEGASGAEIDFDNIELQDFQTLSAIEKAFFTVV
ncbi:holo-ACP synthase [Streptomyces sp. NPDC102283]|uniref:holo-ACP synthase n=1 Tax=Streptomyces sp. NPDC102283 TaxID=3366155 RepID=UPI0038305DA2